jgi:cysteinyl-tRNA synthetase
VHIKIINPIDNILGNFSMSFDELSGKWKYSSAYVDLGIYTYIILAKDTSDNIAKASGTFEIIKVPDTTPPSISNIMDSPDPQISGGIVQFVAIVLDDEGISGVSIEIFDPLDTRLGNFLMNFDTLNDKWKYSSPFTNLGLYTYTIIAKDTSNNSANTSGSFEIIAGSDTLSLSQIKVWADQIQVLTIDGAVDKLADTHYDMLVLEPTRTDWSSSDKNFDTKGMVEKLKNTKASDGIHRKLVLAYIDIGEAEDWRWYWNWSTHWPKGEPKPDDWPDYIITQDPDGWGGCYPVAYWDEDWKDVVIYGNNQNSSPYGDYNSVIDEVIKDGFDGIYIDWVEAYEDEDVMAAAQAEGKDPATEMINFIQEMRTYAELRVPDFIIIQQNAASLCEGHTELFDIIDAIAQEAIWYDGDATDDWDDPYGYDQQTDLDLINYYLGYLEQFKSADLPVFACEYALQYADDAYQKCYDNGFIPYCTRRSLGEVTTTPPPEY